MANTIESRMAKKQKEKLNERYAAQNSSQTSGKASQNMEPVSNSPAKTSAKINAKPVDNVASQMAQRQQEKQRQRTIDNAIQYGLAQQNAARPFASNTFDRIQQARANEYARSARRENEHVNPATSNNIRINPAQLAEFSKYSFENRTADENLKGYAAAEQENRRPKSAGFVNPISANNTYNFGDTIRTKQTGAGGNVSRDGRRISSASANYEESFKSAYAPQREASIAAAQNDSNNPMNLANQFLERNAVEDVGHNARWKESAAYSKMTDDEKAVYNYVYSTYGPARAEEYKNGLMDELNARVGQDIYSNNIEGANTAEKALYSYGSGFMSGLEGVANAPAAFLGVENRQATDPEQLASSYLRSDEDNNRAQKILYDIASSTGNMTPGILMSAAGVPTALSSVEFGAAQAGNAYNQALQNGNTASQSSAYAVQQFADEQLTNMLLNGVNAFGGGLVQKAIGAGPVGQAINRAIDKVAKTDTGRRLLRSIMRSVGNAAGEAQQEYLQFYTENFTQALLGMKDENGNVIQMNLNPADPEALYSAALGALNAFALNTPSDISRVIGGARADVSDARSIADSIAESTREDYSSDEAFEQAQELRAVSEEIARKQEAGVEVTAADRIAFNESMSDMIQIGMESEEETEEYAPNQVEGFDDELEDASMTEEIANERQEGIAELAEGMGEAGADAFKRMYGNSGTENVMDYSSAFNMLYNAARAGDEDALALARNSDAVQKLTYQQQSAAVSAGIADGRADAVKTEGQNAFRAFEESEAVRLPENVRKDMINAYNGDVRMDAYQQAYKRAFVAGENGVDINVAKRSPLATAYLNRGQFEQAYNAGVKLSNVVENRAYKQGPARNGGLTYADKNATKAQKKIAKWVGNKTGLSVEIRSDITGGAEIDIKNGVLRVNPQSKNFNQSISHELTHLIRQYDPEGYNKYRELAVDALMNSRGQSYDQLYELYESKYAETGTTPNVDDVIEEMVADASGQFLNDEEFINRVVQEDRSLAEKIIDFFRGIVDALRESMSQEGLSNTSKALRENYETYSKALDVWTNALNNTAESYQSGLTVDDSASIAESPAYTGSNPNGTRFQHVVATDEKAPNGENLLDFLNGQVEDGDYTVTYKAFLRIDDTNGDPTYYSPMASLEKDEKGKYTKLRNGVKIDQWLASDGKLTNEDIAKMKMKESKNGSPWGTYGNFILKKADENGKPIGDVEAAYNPYQHSSDQVLNDQFESAYKRPNVVVVECRIPNSEINDPYWAKYAKDPTGMHDWKSGPIADQLKETVRHVYMTRWVQPVRELPATEVAQKIYDVISKEKTQPKIYWNNLNPDVLTALEDMGVEIEGLGSPNYIKDSANVKLDRYGKPIPLETLENRWGRKSKYAEKYNEAYNKAREIGTGNSEKPGAVRKQIDFDHPELAKDTGIYKGEDLISKNYSRYSLETYDSVGRKNLSDQLKKEVASKNMTKKTADKITKQMEWAYDMVKKYSNTGDFPMFSAWQTAEYKLQEDGTPVFSVVVPNGEYSLNLDFTTVCKKRDTLDQVLTALAQSGNLNYKKLNQKQLAKINEIIKRNGFEIACSTCFVDSKRYNISNWAHSLTDGTKSRNGFNQAIASMLNDKVGAEYFNYVSSATKYNGKDTYTAGQRLLSDLSNEELLKLNPHAFDYIDDRMKKISPKSYEYRMLKAIKENQSLRSFLNPNDFISSMGQDIIQEQNPALHTLLQSLGGSSRPKPSHGRVAYYSEVINNNSFTPEAAYKVGGVRVQSFSDYMANMVFDYMQMIADMSAKQLPSHAYTKEPMFAKLYGMTGMKINMSIMPRAVDWVKILGIENLNNAQQAVRIYDTKNGLIDKQKRQLRKYAGLEMRMDEKGNFVPVTDENGRYIPIVDDETFPMEEALAIRSAEGYKQNCGTIWIGTSDEQIRTLLRMEEADMVIPYHASSLNPVVKEMRNIEFMHDYTAQQRTRRNENGKWKAIPAKNEFDFYESLMRTKDGKATANEYLAWCDEHGYRPKFDQFRTEENYYKLLEDFRLYDGDASVMQGAVQMNFPGTDSAFGDFESLMLESLKDSSNTAESLGKKLPVILNQINDELGLNSTKNLRKQLNIDESDAKQYAPVFYSKLEREVEGFKGNKIGAASVESYLKGKGVKDEEIKWSGIRTFLEGKKSVGKQELMDYLKANELQIETINLVPGGTSPIWSNGYSEINEDHYYDSTGMSWKEYANQDEFKDDVIARAKEDGYSDDEIEFTFEDGYWAASSSDNGFMVEAYPPDLYELRDADYSNKTATKWENYSLNGGENYREILFKLPGSDFINRSMRIHWKGETGILAHARVQDFQANDGGKVLFVEEIQSDWHNEGKKDGYDGDKKTGKDKAYYAAEISKNEEAFRKDSRNAQLRAELEKNGYSGAGIDMMESFLLDKDRRGDALRVLKDRSAELDSYIDEYAKKQDDLYGAWYLAPAYTSTVPDAPFRDSYTNFALKDLLRMAAEGNYDYLAWTTGKMQEERWSDAFAEGYRIEYDQEIPSFLKKYGKQWKAGLSEITVNDDNKSVVPAITVNDAMKQSVLYEGQPRFQLDVDDSGNGFETDELFSDNQDIKAASETLGKILSDIDEMPTKKAINNAAVQLRKATGTNMEMGKIKENLNSIYEYLAFNRNVDGADISHIVADLAGEMIQSSNRVNASDRENYNEYRKFLNSYTFHMPKGFEGEVEKLGGVGALRREFFGTLNITNEKGSSIDEIWDELSDQYPEYFSKDITNPADQLEQLVDITRSLKPSPEIDAMTDEDFDVYRYRVGQDILKAFVDNGKNAEMREKYDQLLKKGLQKAKDKAKAQKEKAKLRKLDREARTSLLTKANQLAKMKGGPAFEAAKESLIGDLDLIAKGMKSNTRAKLESFRQRAEALAATDENYKALYYDSDKEVFDRLSKKQIKDMTGEEVEELTTKIVELIHQERTTKRMLNESQGAMAATVARRAISQQERVKGIDDRHIVSSFFGRWKLNMLNPTRAFQRIDGYQNGGVFTELGKQLNDGQTKMNDFVMKASKKFNGFLEEHPDLVKTWSNADIDTGFKDRNGNPVYISKGMRIALYLHSLNQQNMRHIAEGGIKIPDANLYNKGKYQAAYRYGAEIRLKPTDLQAIVANMTEDEKAFAALAHDFLNNDTKQAINETSLTLSGTMKAMVDNYFPIRSDPNFTMRDITGLVMDGTVEGMGMLKERVKGASNQILLEDVAQVLQRQTNNTARYYGLAIPVRDFNKVMKFKEAGVSEGVRNAIDKAWGDAGLDYITDVLNNIQAGAPADNGPGARLFNSLKSTYAGTVLNWNLGVAIKQSASAPFAAVVLDAPSVAKALFTPQGLQKVDYDYMDSITPWSYMRRQGASGTEMGEVYKQKNAIEQNKGWQKFKSATNFIQNVDVWTTNRLFNATEMYVQAHYPNIPVRSEAYNEMVADLYNEMLQRTQPSYDVMQRNAYLRSGNTMTKIMGMFKTQTFNMGGEVIDAAGRWRAYEQLYKDGRIFEGQLKEARAQFGKTVTATVVSQLMLAALGVVAKAVMHNMKGYRDDKGEVTPESTAAQGMYEFLTSFAGMGMGGNELQSLLLALSGKEKWYDIAYPGLSVANDLASSSVDVSDAFRKALDKGWDPESVANLKKKIAQFAMNAAIIKRIPADNLYKIANAIHLHIEDWKKGMFGSFDSGEGLLGLKDSSVSKAEYAKQAIYEYEQGNDVRAEYALGNTGKTQLENALGAEASYDENGDTISGSKQNDALNKINALDISNEAKANLIETMYPKLDVEPDLITEFIDMNAAKSEGKQDGVVEYLQGADLTDESKRKLWELAGYKDSTYDKKMGTSEAPTRGMPTRGGYISEGDVYNIDNSLKGRLKLAWEHLTDTDMAPDMRLKAIVAALTGSYSTPDISEFDTPEYVSSFHRTPSMKTRNISGTAKVSKGNPVFWDGDTFGYIMENWPTEITAPYQEMYDNFESPSLEELQALIAAHPEQEIESFSYPVSENPYAAVPIIQQRIDDAETVDDKVKTAYDYIANTLGMGVSYTVLNEMSEMGMPSNYTMAMFNLLPEEEQRQYVQITWPYELLAKYGGTESYLSDAKFKKMVKENWNKVEGDKALRRLAMSTVRSR